MTNQRESYNAALGNLFSLDRAAPEEAIGAVLNCSEAVFAVVAGRFLQAGRRGHAAPR